MPYLDADDAIKLYYEETGSGKPVIFVHEFAGNFRTWEPQVRYFSRLYRCITFNARGYPPSDVPGDDRRYSQARARDDIKAVLDHIGVGRAHIVGHSMGAFAALHFALAYPERAESVILAGCGYGAEPNAREGFLALTIETADLFRREGNPRAAQQYGRSSGRLQFQHKDPRGYAEFLTMLCENSAEGSALTMSNVQRLRPSLWDLQDALKALRAPTLIISGDEDQPCLEPGLFLKRLIPNAGLVVIPMSGHTINSEEPARFNAEIEHFFAAVELKRWGRGSTDG
jgi:pimeloyl-ACP methyl ester carboxylesterase